MTMISTDLLMGEQTGAATHWEGGKHSQCWTRLLRSDMIA